MLSNEQRAHDFTIAAFPMIYDAKIKELLRSSAPGSTISADMFEIYMEIYNEALTAFEKRFPK